MNGILPEFQSQLAVTLLDDGWMQPRWERELSRVEEDEETRDYLRERALVEQATARRIFRDDV